MATQAADFVLLLFAFGDCEEVEWMFLHDQFVDRFDAALGSFAKSLLAEVCVNRAAAEATVRQERGHKIFRLMAVQMDFCHLVVFGRGDLLVEKSESWNNTSRPSTMNRNR